MNHKQAIDAIRAYFATEWDDTTPVAYDDVPFTIPSSQTWVRLNIAHADGYQSSIGNPGANYFRRTGIVTVQVFQPQGKGGNDARTKADLIADLFIGVENSGITYYDVTVKEIGNDGAGFYQINVLAKFRYDRIT